MDKAYGRMQGMHRKIARRYGACLSEQTYRTSLAVSLLFFAGSLIVNFYAILFATEHASNPVADLILSNTPVFDVDYLFVYGTLFAATIAALIGMAYPKRLPFAFKAIALFLLIRSGFTSLTHLGPFTPYVASDFGNTITKTFFGGDRFFSGHTGLPFLGALGFWRETLIRYFFLATSVFFGIVVLLGHLHYSIDVFSAFFITYTIFQIAVWLFPKDYARFMSEQ